MAEKATKKELKLINNSLKKVKKRFKDSYKKYEVGGIINVDLETFDVEVRQDLSLKYVEIKRHSVALLNTKYGISAFLFIYLILMRECEGLMKEEDDVPREWYINKDAKIRTILAEICEIYLKMHNYIEKE